MVAPTRASPLSGLSRAAPRREGPAGSVSPPPQLFNCQAALLGPFFIAHPQQPAAECVDPLNGRAGDFPLAALAFLRLGLRQLGR